MGEQRYLCIHLKISCKPLILQILRDTLTFFMNDEG